MELFMESARDRAMSHNNRGIPPKEQKGFFLHRLINKMKRNCGLLIWLLTSITFRYQLSLCVYSIPKTYGTVVLLLALGPVQCIPCTIEV